MYIGRIAVKVTLGASNGNCGLNSRNRIPAGSPAQQPAPVASPRQPGPAGSWVPRLVAALIIRKAPAHRRFGHKTLGADFVEVVAALGTGVSVILPSLMIGVDQGIVGEHKTFGEAVKGVLLYEGRSLSPLSSVMPNTSARSTDNLRRGELDPRTVRGR